MQLRHWQCNDADLQGLIRRAELAPSLVRRQIEEEITALVNLPSERREGLLAAFRDQHQLQEQQALASWLEQRGWQLEDLELHVCRPEALALFMRHLFGPGLEDEFLNRKTGLDTAIYSLLRVRDAGLARELWIQLSEGETSFAEAASRYSDGPEASTKGVIGPISLGQVEPVLADRLRSLQAGELRPPEQLGSWHVLLRLEQLSPARLDEAMQQRLLHDQFEAWIRERAEALLSGGQPDPLDYHPPHEPG